MANRRDILDTLETKLREVSGIQTVVRTYMNIDMTQYSSSDLPLIEIREPEEATEQEMTGRRSIMSLEMKIKVWFINWGENPTPTYEALMKAIRDKIGEEFHLGGYIQACWITGISPIEGIMPLFWYEMTLRMLYCLNQLAT